VRETASSNFAAKLQVPNSKEGLSFNTQIKSVEAVLRLMIESSLKLVAWDLMLLPAASNLLKQFVIRRDRD
jgi:hypothetical protein